MDVGEYSRSSGKHLTAPHRRLVNRSEVNFPQKSDEPQMIRYSDRERQSSPSLRSDSGRVSMTDQTSDRYSNNGGQISWKKLVKKVRKQHPPFFNEEDGLLTFGSSLPHFGQLDTLFGKANPVGPFSLLDNVGKDLFSNSTGNDCGIPDHAENFSSNTTDSQSLDATYEEGKQSCALKDWEKTTDKCNENPVTTPHGQFEEDLQMCETLQYKASRSIPDGNYNHLHPDGSAIEVSDNSFQDEDQRTKYQDVENKYQDLENKYEDAEKTFSDVATSLQVDGALLEGLEENAYQSGDEVSGLFVINEELVDDNKLTRYDASSGSTGVNTTTPESVPAVNLDFSETECNTEKSRHLVEDEEKDGEVAPIEESVLKEGSNSSNQMDLTAVSSESQVVHPTSNSDTHSMTSTNIVVMENIASGPVEVADTNIVDDVSSHVLENRNRFTVEDDMSSNKGDESISESIESENVGRMSESIESENAESGERKELRVTDTVDSEEKGAPKQSSKKKSTGEITSDALRASKTSSEEKRTEEITSDSDVLLEKHAGDICKEMARPAKGDGSQENSASSVETHRVISNEEADICQESNQTDLNNCEINFCKDIPQKGVCDNGDQITLEVCDKGSKPVISQPAGNDFDKVTISEPDQNEVLSVKEGVKEMNETRRMNLGFLRVSNLQQTQITPPRGFITIDQLSDFDSPGKSAAMDSVGEERMWGSAISDERKEAGKGNLNTQISETPLTSNLGISSDCNQATNSPPSHHMQGKDNFASVPGASMPRRQDLEGAKTCQGENISGDQETCTVEYALSHPDRNESITLESASVKAAVNGDGPQDVDCRAVAASGQSAVSPNCTWSEIVNFSLGTYTSSSSPCLTTTSANNQLDNSWNSVTTPSSSNTQAPTTSAPVICGQDNQVGELVQVVNDLFSAHPYVGMAESVNISALLSSAKCLQDSADLLDNLQKTPPPGSLSSVNKQLVTPPKMSLLSPRQVSVMTMATDGEGENQELSTSVINKMMVESLTDTAGNSTASQSNSKGKGGENHDQDIYSLPIEYSFGDSDNNFCVNLKAVKDSPMSASKDVEISTQVCDEDFGNIATYICQEEGETAQVLHVTETGNVICNTVDCGARLAFPEQFAISDIPQGADSNTPSSALEAHPGREKESDNSKKLNDKPSTRKMLKRHATKKQVCSCEDCMEVERPNSNSENPRRGNTASGKGITVDTEVVPYIAMEVEILNDNQDQDQENAFVPPTIADSAKSSDAEWSTCEGSEKVKVGPPGSKKSEMSKVKKRRKSGSSKNKSVKKREHKMKEKCQRRRVENVKQPDSRADRRSKTAKKKRKENRSSVNISPGRFYTNISEEEEVQKAAEALTSLFSSDDMERSTEINLTSVVEENFPFSAVGNSCRAERTVPSDDNDSSTDGAIAALADALSSTIQANLSEVTLREKLASEPSEHDNGSFRSAKQQPEGNHKIKSGSLEKEKDKKKKKKIKKKEMKRREKEQQLAKSKSKTKTASPPDDVCGMSKKVSKKSHPEGQFPQQEGCTNRSKVTASHKAETKFLCASTHKVKMLGVQDYSLSKPCNGGKRILNRTEVISSVSEPTEASTMKHNVEASASVTPGIVDQTRHASKFNERAAANVASSKSLENTEKVPSDDMSTDKTTEEDSPTRVSKPPMKPLLFEVKLQKDDSYSGQGGEDDNPHPITYLQAILENSESDHTDLGKKKCSSVEEPLQIRRASNKEMAEMIATFTSRLDGNMDSVEEEGSTSSNLVTGDRDADERCTAVSDVRLNQVDPDEVEYSATVSTNSADSKNRKIVNHLERVVSPALMRKYTQIRKVSEKSRARRKRKFQQIRLGSSLVHAVRNTHETKTVNKVYLENLSRGHMSDGSTRRKEPLHDNQGCRQSIGATPRNGDGATPRNGDGATPRNDDGATPRNDDGATAKCAERNSEEWTSSSDLRIRPVMSSVLTDKDDGEVVETNTVMDGNNMETDKQENKADVQEHNNEDDHSELPIYEQRNNCANTREFSQDATQPSRLEFDTLMFEGSNHSNRLVDTDSHEEEEEEQNNSEKFLCEAVPDKADITTNASMAVGETEDRRSSSPTDIMVDLRDQVKPTDLYTEGEDDKGRTSRRHSVEDANKSTVLWNEVRSPRVHECNDLRPEEARGRNDDHSAHKEKIWKYTDKKQAQNKTLISRRERFRLRYQRSNKIISDTEDEEHQQTIHRTRNLRERGEQKGKQKRRLMKKSSVGEDVLVSDKDIAEMSEKSLKIVLTDCRRQSQTSSSETMVSCHKMEDSSDCKIVDVLSKNLVKQPISGLHTRSNLQNVGIPQSHIKLPKAFPNRTPPSSQDDVQCSTYSVGQSRKWTSSVRRHPSSQENHSCSDEEFSKRSFLFNRSLRRSSSQMKRKVRYDDRSCDGDSECSEAEPPLKRLKVVPGLVYVSEVVADGKEERHLEDNCKSKEELNQEELSQELQKEHLLEGSDLSSSDRELIIEKVHRRMDDESKNTTGDKCFEEKQETDEEGLVVRVSEIEVCVKSNTLISKNDESIEISPGKLSDTLQMVKDDNSVNENAPGVQLNTSEASSRLAVSNVSDGDEVFPVEQVSCENDSSPKCKGESLTHEYEKEECNTSIRQEKSSTPAEKLSSTLNQVDSSDQSDSGRVSCSPCEDTFSTRSNQEDILLSKDFEKSLPVQGSSTVAKSKCLQSPHSKVINVNHSSVKMRSCVILLKRLDVSLFSELMQTEQERGEYDEETEMEEYLSSSDIQGASTKRQTDRPVSRDSQDIAGDRKNDKKQKRQRREEKMKKSRNLRKKESPFGSSLKSESTDLTSEDPWNLQIMEQSDSNKELTIITDCLHEEKQDKHLSSSLKYLSESDVDSAGSIKKDLLKAGREQNDIHSSVKESTGNICRNDGHDGEEDEDVTIPGNAKSKTEESGPTDKRNQLINVNKISIPKEDCSVLLKPLKYSVLQKIAATSDSSTVDLSTSGHLSEAGRSRKRKKKKKKRDEETKRRKVSSEWTCEDKTKSDLEVNQLLCQEEQVSDVSLGNCHLPVEDSMADKNNEMRTSPPSGEYKTLHDAQMEEDDFMEEPKQESRSDEIDKLDSEFQGTFHDEDCLSITADSPDFFNDFGEEEEEAVQESERVPETSEVVESLEYEDVSSDGESPVKERQSTAPLILMPVKLMPKIPKKLTASISNQPNRVCHHGAESSPPPVTRKFLPNVPFIQFDNQSHPAMPVPTTGEHGEVVTIEQQRPSSSGTTSKQATEAGWQLTDTNKLAHKIPSGYCFQFAELGKCRYGKSCRYKHVLLKNIPSVRKVDSVSSGLLRASPSLPYPPSLLDKVLDTPHGVTEEMKRSIQAIPPLSPSLEFKEPLDDTKCDLLSHRVHPRKSLDEQNPQPHPPQEVPDFLESVVAHTVNERNLREEENPKGGSTQMKERAENVEGPTNASQEKIEGTKSQVTSNISTDENCELRKHEVTLNLLTEERQEAEGTDRQNLTSQVMCEKKNEREVTTVETNSSGIFDKKFRLVRNSNTAQKSSEKTTSERDPFSDVRQLIKKKRVSDAWNVYRLKIQENEYTPNLSLHLEIVSSFPSSISPFKWKDCKEALNEIGRCFSLDSMQYTMDILKQLNGLYEEGSDGDDDLLSVAVNIFKDCVPHQQTFQGEPSILSKLSDHLFKECHFALLSVFVSTQADKGFTPSLSSLENVLFKYHALNNHHEELLQLMRKLDKINMELPAYVYDRVKKCLELSPYPDDCVEILQMKGRFHQLDPIEECLAVSQSSDPNMQPSLLSVNTVDDDLVESHGNDDGAVFNLGVEKCRPTKFFTGTRMAISDTVQKAKDVKTLAELFLTIYKTDRIYLSETEIQACFSTGTISVSPSKPHLMYREFVEYINGENVLDNDGSIYLVSIGKELFLAMWRKKAFDMACHVLDTIFQMEYEAILTVFVNLSTEKMLGRYPFNSFCCLVQCCLRTKNTFISHKLLLGLQNNKWDHYFWDKTVKTQIWQHCYEDLANQLIIAGYLEECLQLLVRVGESHCRIRKTPKGRRLIKEPFNSLLDKAYARNDITLVNRIIPAIKEFSTFKKEHIHRLVTELVSREDKESFKQARDIYHEGLQEGAYLSHCIKDDLHEGRIQVTYTPEEIYLVLCEYFSQSDMYLSKMFSKKPSSWAKGEVCNIFSLRDEDICFRILVTVVGTHLENGNLQEAEHAIDSTIIKVVKKLGLLIPNFDTHVETMTLQEKVVVMKMEDIKKRYLSNHPKYGGGRGKR